MAEAMSERAPDYARSHYALGVIAQHNGTCRLRPRNLPPQRCSGTKPMPTCRNLLIRAERLRNRAKQRRTSFPRNRFRNRPPEEETALHVAKTGLFAWSGCDHGCAGASAGQNRAIGSYSYMHFSATPVVNLNGAELGGQYKIADWLGAAADLTGEYGKVGRVTRASIAPFWTTGYVAAPHIAVRARAIGRRAF